MKYLFEWTPAISVGDAIIDEQHQRLLGEVNTLLSYIVSKKALEIENYIGNWWLTHIAVEDHKYAEFIKAHEA